MMRSGDVSQPAARRTRRTAAWSMASSMTSWAMRRSLAEFSALPRTRISLWESSTPAEVEATREKRSQRLAMTPSLSVAAHEHRHVWGHDAFGATGHDELDAPLHLGRGRPEARGEESGIGRRREAAREVVDAAVAFGLAEDGDHVGRVDGAGVELGGE